MLLLVDTRQCELACAALGPLVLLYPSAETAHMNEMQDPPRTSADLAVPHSQQERNCSIARLMVRATAPTPVDRQCRATHGARRAYPG